MILKKLIYFCLFILIVRFSNGQSKECGVQVTKPKVFGNLFGRIINGERAVEASWPWLVSLRNLDKKLSHFCGASLIDLDVAITAAHCVEDMDVKEFVIVVGAYDALKKPEMSNIYLVKEYKIHSSYDGTKLQQGYDIALIKLIKPVVLNKNVSLICLPKSSDVDSVVQKDLIAAGWGIFISSYLKNWMPPRLQQTRLKIIDGDERCVRVLGEYDESRIYCAHDNMRQSNICMGDSGGPLMYYSGGKWYLYGLTSYLSAFNDVCVNMEPSFFTKVPVYVNGSNQVEFEGNWTTGPPNPYKYLPDLSPLQ